MQNLHKDNAKFMIAALWRPVAGNVHSIFGTCEVNQPTQTGANFLFNTATGNVTFRSCNGSGSYALAPAGAQRQRFAASIDEAAGSGFIVCNSRLNTFTNTYAAPTSGNANYTAEIAERQRFNAATLRRASFNVRCLGGGLSQPGPISRPF